MLTLRRKIQCVWCQVDPRCPILAQVAALLVLQDSGGTIVARAEDMGPFSEPEWAPVGRTRQQLDRLLAVQEVAETGTSQTASQRTALIAGNASAGGQHDKGAS